MNTIHPLNVLLVLLVLLCMKTSSFGSKDGKQMTMRCIEREREALLLFRQSVANANDDLDSWNEEQQQDCCKWKGVGCDNHTGHVTHLLLSSLISPFPSDLIYSGRSHVYSEGTRYLNLSFNYFDGPIPKSIGSLNSLRYLDLSYSWLTGVIPHELGNLSKLQHLALGHNFILKGGENINWLFNLSSLTHLDLSGVPIDPPTIWASFIQRIPSLSVLHLSYCNLLSPSSAINNFSSSISILHLDGNNITSSIFNWLSYLSGSLVELDLSSNLLEGRIPESFSHMTALTYLDLRENQLTGVLLKSIYKLSSLQVADFSSNNFTGNLDDLLSGPFRLLQRLRISGNKLTGSLPDITQLSFLRELALNSNQLNGYLPTVFEHHSALQFLNLSSNHLRGVLPDFTRFSSLTWLYLDNNEFSGSLPNFTGCSSLRELQLSENRLTEWETQSTGLLASLEDLDLSRNSIHSTISELHLFNLSSLKNLRTSFNSLTFKFSSAWLPPFQLQEISLASCKLGPKFPNWIRNQRNIHHLDFSNTQISDTIPIWLWNLTSSMLVLNLSSNKIRGKLSWKYDHIREIDLSSNYLVGSLPPIPENCLKINLSKNKFSGTFLSLSVVQDIYLRFLDVSHNHLFGALPDNWLLFQSLVFLNLGYNNFSGRIPMSIGHLVSLQTLILRNNKLSGELPASLRNCRSLGFVDFGLNELSGKVPSWIGEDLSELYALILKFNRFNGSLPYEICYLSNLHFLDLSQNRISGNIPPCFGNLTAMTQIGTEVSEHTYSSESTIALFDSESPASGPIPSPVDGPTRSYSYFDIVVARWKGQEFEYGRNFAYLKMIDLSTNELTGEIPTGITRLLELKGLNFSGNKFIGRVPLEIGQLKGLECLDLSKNRFSGEIPPSMSGLNFLAYLDVSDNNFSGRIPSGTQLQGFSISAYEGNTGLCGKPLTNSCPGDEPSDDIHRSYVEVEVDGEDIEYKKWLYISAVLGFSTTFWGFIGSLVLNRRWRHAYFLFLYNLKESIYVTMAVRIARLQRTV
ncbi:Receptor-like protein EIX2 [Heracleum sosnowskyi]|uniref:Receptor-like protein EIX2 n=1 Tax=Heracleum sosnowskyi TaxID=360622 RepID=A0AAD8HE27_9APIA|nr:Receptor-like protein EIX2 [Heracleum sosnowskyi]